jgi:hypothetical protein
MISRGDAETLAQKRPFASKAEGLLFTGCPAKLPGPDTSGAWPHQPPEIDLDIEWS